MVLQQNSHHSITYFHQIDATGVDRYTHSIVCSILRMEHATTLIVYSDTITFITACYHYIAIIAIGSDTTILRPCILYA